MIDKKKNHLIIFTVLSILFFLFPYPTIPAPSEQDNWQAQPMHIVQLADSAPIPAYSPAQIRNAYNLPSTGGYGNTIAIVIAYHTPNIIEDLNVFSGQFGLPVINDSNFEVHKMANEIEVVGNWSMEASLDVQWAHAIAPDAKILLVEALSNRRQDLLAAIDYARARPDVVSISLSWGGDEPSNPSFYNQRLSSNYGAVFFAASGDNGSGVLWPASSSKVVAVGGTSLRIGADGSVISEIGWTGSGGGVSAYEPIPLYQSNFGILGSKRAVPDVAYNANPTYGFAVYFNSTWRKVGGTSAGAPQWAAIYALGLSASHTNLYGKANISYPSFFRDITLGSNGGYNATSGYDLVTGLGCPLTSNFGAILAISPTFGGPETPIIIEGKGFNPSTSVSLSYLNPVDTNWIPIADNLSVSSATTFNLTLKAPDLLLNNLPGDNEPIFDNLIFRAVENNGSSFEATTPFIEYRRGFTQVGSSSANGIFGNGTELTISNILQGGSSIVLIGKWLISGDCTVSLDDTKLLDSSIDETGRLEVNVEIPTLAYGPHLLTIVDQNSNFYLIVNNVSVQENPQSTISPLPTITYQPTPIPSPSTTPQPTVKNTPVPTPKQELTPTNTPQQSNTNFPMNKSPFPSLILDMRSIIGLFAIFIAGIIIIIVAVARKNRSINTQAP